MANLKGKKRTLAPFEKACVAGRLSGRLTTSGELNLRSMSKTNDSKSALQRFRDWAHTTRKNYNLVQGEATMETLRRFRLFAAVTILVNLVYVSEFWIFPKFATTFLQKDYVNRIGWTHAIMACLMLLLGVMAHLRSRNNKRASGGAIALQLTICSTYLAFGITISTIDQMVSTSITSFVLVCVLVGVMSVMRPLLLAPLLAVAFTVLHQVMALTQPDVAALDRIRGDGRLVIVLSLLVSTVVWVQYVSQVLLRKELTGINKALADKQSELLFTSTHDELTGLFNRREFVRLALVELARAVRIPGPTSLVMADVDFFKKINDRYGHPAGDEVLQQVAGTMTAAVRSMDVVARMGGEEFVVLLPNTDRTGALAVAEKIRATLTLAPCQLGSASFDVTASFGVSELPSGQSGTLEDLYAAADHALYAAKSNGRNRVEFELAQSLAFPSNFRSLRS
jgi:diguanylate cyclase (GGDEF)-like protein